MPGLEGGRWDGTDVPEEELAAGLGLVGEARPVGVGGVADRLWAGHAVSVLGLDAPSVERGGNVVIPSARAKVAVRIPPGADARASLDAVAEHLRRHAPWGAQVAIEVQRPSSGVRLPGGGAFQTAAVQALEAAFGSPVARIGSGGSVPLVERLADGPHPRRRRERRPRRAGALRCRRGAAAGGPRWLSATATACAR